MSISTGTAVQISASADEQKQADLIKLDELFLGAKVESDAYEALKRKMAAAVFRCGAKLAEAKPIAKKHKINWYDKLEQYGIAESTASQAVKLYENARDAGYMAEDLENLPITKAKSEFKVIKSPTQVEAERKLKEEAVRKLKEEERRITLEPESADHQPTLPPPPAHSHEGDVAQAPEEAEFGKIEISDLLIFRQKQLKEEVLQLWNADLEQPFDEDYLLVLLDMGVLSVDDDQVRYLPDQDKDREELVGVITDNLAPILKRWTTHDDLMATFKGLVFADEAEDGPKTSEVEGAEANAETLTTQVPPNRRGRVRGSESERSQ
jgi:hypothetical protein